MNSPNNYTQTKESQSVITPEMALQKLKEGNQRFTEKKTLSRDLHKQIELTRDGQFPFAALVSCIDSRVPPEVIFDQGIGDIFVGRTAGNVVDKDMLGSLEFACKVAGAKLVLAMGHTRCGAVKGAYQGAQLGNLTGLLTKIRPAVDKVRSEYSEDEENLLNAAVLENVKNTISAIREQSVVLSEMEEQGQIILTGAVYHVENGSVEFL